PQAVLSHTTSCLAALGSGAPQSAKEVARPHSGCAASGLPPPAPPVSESRRAFRRRPHRVPAAWYFLVVGYFDCGGGEISATKSQMMCATGCFGSPALLAGVCWTYLTCNRSHRPRSFKI